MKGKAMTKYDTQREWVLEYLKEFPCISPFDGAPFHEDWNDQFGGRMEVSEHGSHYSPRANPVLQRMWKGHMLIREVVAVKCKSKPKRSTYYYKYRLYDSEEAGVTYHEWVNR